MGAPGVGRSVAICAPAACALVNAVVSVIPVPATNAPAAWADLSGAVTLMVAPAPPLPGPPLPPVVPAITAVSWSMTMLCPAVNPNGLATGIAVAPAAVAVLTVVAPAVPTAAIVAVSEFAPESTINF